MLCREIMKFEVECVAPETTLRDAARKMRDHNVGFLPVCDESMRVIGVLTDRDIAIRAVAGDLLPTATVQSALTRHVVACRPDDDLQSARSLMSKHHVSRVMCLGETGRIEGVISLSDLIQLDEVGGAATLRHVSDRESNAWPEARVS
jgi:CBS domain-containing protein